MMTSRFVDGFLMNKGDTSRGSTPSWLQPFEKQFVQRLRRREYAPDRHDERNFDISPPRKGVSHGQMFGSYFSFVGAGALFRGKARSSCQEGSCGSSRSISTNVVTEAESESRGQGIPSARQMPERIRTLDSAGPDLAATGSTSTSTTTGSGSDNGGSSCFSSDEPKAARSPLAVRGILRYKTRSLSKKPGLKVRFDLVGRNDRDMDAEEDNCTPREQVPHGEQSSLHLGAVGEPLLLGRTSASGCFVPVVDAIPGSNYQLPLFHGSACDLFPDPEDTREGDDPDPDPDDEDEGSNTLDQDEGAQPVRLVHQLTELYSESGSSSNTMSDEGFYYRYRPQAVVEVDAEAAAARAHRNRPRGRPRRQSTVPKKIPGHGRRARTVAGASECLSVIEQAASVTLLQQSCTPAGVFGETAALGLDDDDGAVGFCETPTNFFVDDCVLPDDLWNVDDVMLVDEFFDVDVDAHDGAGLLGLSSSSTGGAAALPAQGNGRGKAGGASKNVPILDPGMLLRMRKYAEKTRKGGNQEGKAAPIECNAGENSSWSEGGARVFQENAGPGIAAAPDAGAVLLASSSSSSNKKQKHDLKLELDEEDDLLADESSEDISIAKDRREKSPPEAKEEEDIAGIGMLVAVEDTGQGTGSAAEQASSSSSSLAAFTLEYNEYYDCNFFYPLEDVRAKKRPFGLKYKKIKTAASRRKGDADADGAGQLSVTSCAKSSSFLAASSKRNGGGATSVAAGGAAKKNCGEGDAAAESALVLANEPKKKRRRPFGLVYRKTGKNGLIRGHSGWWDADGKKIRKKWIRPTGLVYKKKHRSQSQDPVPLCNEEAEVALMQKEKLLQRPSRSPFLKKNGTPRRKKKSRLPVGLVHENKMKKELCRPAPTNLKSKSRKVSQIAKMVKKTTHESKQKAAESKTVPIKIERKQEMLRSPESRVTPRKEQEVKASRSATPSLVLSGAKKVSKPGSSPVVPKMKRPKTSVAAQIRAAAARKEVLAGKLHAQAVLAKQLLSKPGSSPVVPKMKRAKTSVAAQIRAAAARKGANAGNLHAQAALAKQLLFRKESAAAMKSVVKSGAKRF